MNKPLQITPIRTSLFQEGMDLLAFVLDNLRSHPLKKGSILAVTSKILSLAESRTLSKIGIDKATLIQSEADRDLGEIGYGCRLTIKHGLLLVAAGIDESNSKDGKYILYPKNPFESAKKLHEGLSQALRLSHFGVLITDSHTLPLRQGVTGIALSYWGFQGVKNLVGKTDLFGQRLKMTQTDLADGLAAASVLMMGEADESCPLALIENAPVDFEKETNPNEILIPIEEDIYFPVYRDRLIKPSRA